MLTLAAAAALLSCTVIDGDTLRCGRERVRLLAIDAPELGGKCRLGRQCVEGDAEASKRALERLVLRRRIKLERVGKDRWGRTLAMAWAGRTNLSCAQIQRGRAVYVRQWDNGGRINKSCRVRG